jgi:threonine dehydratase
MSPPAISVAALATAVAAAATRLRPHVIETPLRRTRELESHLGCPVWLKCEHLQHTGSFKLRGAFNKLLALSEDQRAAGVVTASSGNHGLAVAYACQRLGSVALVFVPEGVVSTKAELIQSLGASLHVFGRDCAQTEAHAREFAGTHGLIYVSPYNDVDVIAGQGSIACELVQQTRPLDLLYVAVGGGGLVTGLAAGLRKDWPNAEIVACSPVTSAVMIESLAEGRILDLPSAPTWSDGTAGGLEADTVTFPLCQELVNRSIVVTEDAILDGVRALRNELGVVVEGAAGVAAAAMLTDPERRRGAKVGVIVCGGNASPELLTEFP